MSAILDHGNSYRGIQFVAPDGSGKRPEIRLGKVTKGQADIVRVHVDNLLAAIATRRAAPPDTVEWLVGIGPKLHAKLVKHKLVSERAEAAAVPLKPFIDGYVAGRKDLKFRTRTNLEQAAAKLVEFFKKPDRDLRTITKGEAGDWRRWLQVEKDLSPATISTHVKKARQFFDDAASRGLISVNPFKGIKAGKQTNPSRMHYVRPADMARVFKKCPTVEWETLFALARFGGLRVPSETELLEWADVDWAAGRMNVRSPKTAHHEGRESRVVPIFPELRPFLERARAAADPGARHVLARLRTGNPRTTAVKIVRRSGLQAWPKLFQNLRSSCQTDLTAKFSQHVACAWLGNTEQVARKHYLQVTEADFERAIGPAGKSAAKSAAGTSVQELAGVAHDKQKRGFSKQTQPFQYPQGGANPTEKAPVKVAKRKTALRKALQNRESAEQVDKNQRLEKSARSAAVARAMAAARGGAR